MLGLGSGAVTWIKVKLNQYCSFCERLCEVLLRDVNPPIFSTNPQKRTIVQFPRFGLCDSSLLAGLLFHCPNWRIKTVRLTELSCMKVRLFYCFRAPAFSNFSPPRHVAWLCFAITFDVPRCRSSQSVEGLRCDECTVRSILMWPVCLCCSWFTDEQTLENQCPWTNIAILSDSY